MAASPTTDVADRNRAVDRLLVYDGDCGFCTACARWFERRAVDGAAIAPWQSLDLTGHALTDADVATAAYWLDDGRAWRGADAVAHALGACSGPLRIVGAILARRPVIWIGRAVYALVARFRYRLPGATDACRID